MEDLHVIPGKRNSLKRRKDPSSFTTRGHCRLKKINEEDGKTALLSWLWCSCGGETKSQNTCCRLVFHLKHRNILLSILLSWESSFPSSQLLPLHISLQWGHLSINDTGVESKISHFHFIGHLWCTKYNKNGHLNLSQHLSISVLAAGGWRLVLAAGALCEGLAWVRIR
jgi:hypothetical protein